MGADEVEAAGDDRGAPVGADHEAGVEALHWSRGPLRDALHPGHARAVPDEPGDPEAFAHRDRQRPGALDQDGVEGQAPDREGVIAVAAPAAAPRVVADQRGAVRRDDPHAAERPGAGRFHRLQHPEAVEDPAPFRRQVLAADLVPREARAVEQHHLVAGLGQQDGGGGAGRAGPHHHDVNPRHSRTLR